MTSPMASVNARRISVAGLIAMAVAAVGMFVAGLIMAPAASAAGGEGKIETYSVGNVEWNLLAKYSNHTSAKKQTTPPPAKGKPATPTQRKTPAPTPIDSATLWFYQKGPACISGDGGDVCYSWPAGITEGDCTVHPSADPNYGYDGNGIPLPKPGETAQSRLVSWTVNLIRTQIDDVTPYEDVDPKTGFVVTTGEEVETSYFYEYQWKCNYATAPEVSRAYCATWVKAALNGPYDQSYQPMKSILQGGTNTRTPYGDGVFGTEGKPFEEPSTMGKSMQRDGYDPKSDAPSLKVMQADCIPKNNDSFDKVKTEESSTLGRYEIPQQTWYVRGLYYHFNQGNFANIYPASLKSPSYKDGYQIIDISKPYITKLTTYAKLICWDGTVDSGLIAKIYVGQGTAREWRVLDWGDSAENYYSWNCGASPDDPSKVRTKDFLQCDRYGQRSTAPYQYDRKDYTYHDVQYQEAVRDGWAECASQCGSGEWTSCTYYPDRNTWGCSWGHYEWRTRGERDATPDGWLDNGAYWYRKAAAPDGWIDNGSEYETTNFPNIIVDNKSAAPILGVAQMVNGNPVNVENRGGVWQLSSAADPIHVEWQRVRINTRDGRNVNESGRNVQWDYQYRLAPWSSPKLKNADVNASSQPYHGWVDTTNSLSAAAMPTDRKWEPDKNYSFSTIPYSWSYLPYTFHREDNPTPYTYHQESYQREFDQWSVPANWNGNNWEWSCDGGTAGGGQWGVGVCRRYPGGTETRTVLDPPPAGCHDGGGQYLCPKDVRDATPDGYEDFEGQWRKKNLPPTGWHDNGVDGYTSDDPLNDGYTGGISFNNWRKWPTYAGLDDCEVNPSDYNVNQRDKTYKIKCGDNVTDRTRSAYFRYFMSTTAGAAGWQVTPWWKVTADIQTDYFAVNQIEPSSDGDSEIDSDKMGGKWIRQSYECPGQPFTVNIQRVAE